jgi:hypothetical protein
MAPDEQVVLGGRMVNGVSQLPLPGVNPGAGVLSADAVPVIARPPATTTAAAAVTAAVPRNFLLLLISGSS